MKSPDIKEILINQLDEYTKHHAEKYAKYIQDELMAYINPKRREFISIKGYDEWKISDCCGNSCGCKSVDENLFKDEEAMIPEPSRDSDEWIIKQYNRNRLSADHITNINQIPKDAGKE